MGNDSGKLDFLFPISNSTLNNFLNICSSGVVFLNEDGKALYANKKIEKILGYSRGEIINNPLDIFFTAKDRPKLTSTLKNITNINETNAEEAFDTTVINKNGERVSVSISYNVIQENGKSLFLCIIDDISSHVSLQNKLYKQAITDPLTGIFNRRHFDKKMSQEFKRAKRYSRSFSVIIIDIDGFKSANDIHGHSFGDQMLIKATKIFDCVLREGDSIYRYGGDEFAMLLPETTKEGCIDVAERLKNIFASDFSNNKNRIHLSLSMGVASYPEDGKNETGLIGAADQRMYYSKERGGNMVTAYDELDLLGDNASQTLHSLIRLANLMETKRGIGSHGLNHSQGIRTLSIEIAHRLNMTDDKISLIEQASMLHDIGFISLPTHVFEKKENLSETERNEIKKHTLIGEEIIDIFTRDNQNKELSEIKQIVGQHHERLDGSGYPRGLAAKQIRPEARILAVTDAYNAMRSKRPYRNAFSRNEALEEIKTLSGTHFDSEIVDHLIDIETSHGHKDFY